MSSFTVTTTRKRKIIFGTLFFLAVIATIALIVYLTLDRRSTFLVADPVEERFKIWATALDEPQCAAISGEIYAKGGTVADAAVASLLCLGVVLPESLGLGGGFIAVYFQKSTGLVRFLDARETAPGGATKDMFVGNATACAYGPLAVATPGEVKGYRALLDLVGTGVPQATLFERAIHLAENGFEAGEHLASSMRQKRDLIFANEEMRSVYFNPKTNATWKQHERFNNPKLAATLKRLAESEDFVEEFYAGDLGKEIVRNLQEMGGIMNMEDFKNYKVKVENASFSRMQDKYDVYSANLPGSGAVLSLMINILEAFGKSELPEDALTYHRLAETMKFAYAQRTWLGDSDADNITELIRKMETVAYAEEIRSRIKDDRTLPIEEYGGALAEPRDHGTSHANFFAPNGDVIAITSTVNYYFGSGVQIEGVILNNEMDDFSTPNVINGFGLPPSESNYIEPNKRPMSSMAPAIIVEDGQAKMALGGAGGSQITSAMAEVLMHYVYQGASLGTAIAHARIHHQYMPNRVLHEKECDPYVIRGLAALGHKMYEKPQSQRGSVIVAIAREGDEIVAAFDPRKGGGVSGGPL